ncbi:MAG: RNA polymerase sigma factor [Methylococcaceae bacterium]|jgi:RNA polymerase sigma-70 factor (ECF subfamily)
MNQLEMTKTMTQAMMWLVPTRNQPQIPDKSDTAVDEYALLERIIEGDTSAFEVFYKIYYSKLFRFIQRITHQPESVEELIQETLLVVWEKPDGFNHTSKISTWVFGIAYNKALKLMSKKARRSSNVDVNDLLETIGDPAANPAQNLESEDWLSYALSILPPDQRAVIELTFYHGLPYQDIAKILNCPENTVKTRMFHARKKLQVFAET